MNWSSTSLSSGVFAVPPEPDLEEQWRKSLNLVQSHLRHLEDDNRGSPKLVSDARRRVERVWNQGRPEWRAKGWDRRLPGFLKSKPVEKPE